MTRSLVWLPIVLVLTISPSLFGQAISTPAMTPKPHLVIVIAEDEYHTDQTLPPFASTNLAHDFQITVLHADAQNAYHIPGLEAVRTADLLLLSVRRRPLPPDELAVIRHYLEGGRPLVAIRTASHAFALRSEPPPAGLVEWREFDRDILGCHYHNHHGDQIQTFVRVVPAAAEHPIVQGLPGEEFAVFGSLYLSAPLDQSATLLLAGRAADIQPHEPVAWVRQTSHGGRVFYTSLGHPQDFTLRSFAQLLRNGIYWSAQRPVPSAAAQALERVPER
ncbi:MAG: ThuA domain-containing protein [Pirellulaceae bacterium]